MEINEHIIQLSGKASIPEPLEVGGNYKITMDGSVITETMSDNHDGTANRIFKFKPIVLLTTDKTGKTIKSKDTRSMSQLLRGSIRKRWINIASRMDEEKYYETIMYGIMRDLDILIDKYIDDK